MKRSELIQQLVKIYDTRPENCSSYHIVDMLIYAAERRGMKPPFNAMKSIDNIINGETIDYDVYEWEEDDDK